VFREISQEDSHAAFSAIAKRSAVADLGASMECQGKGIRKRAAIFDLDGTLVDSMPLVFAMFSYAVEPFRPRPTSAEVMDSLGGPPETCIRRLLGASAAPSLPEANARMLAYEQEHFEDVVPFEGSRELLEALHGSGIQLAVWTGRDRHSTTSILRAHGLEPLFGALVCGDDLDSHKPDPAGLLQVLETLGVRPEDTLFLGDTEFDVEGGYGAGVPTIMIHHGRAVASKVAARALAVFEGPADAYAAVALHFGRTT
jgi:HAD superfamily hydrolase (TIGR01509 family)